MLTRFSSCLSGYLGFALLASSLPALAQSNETPALQLLHQVARHYADATSYHIESVTELTNTEFTDTSEFYSSWSKQIIAAYEEPGNRYRFEGKFHSGSGIVVSNGTTEWEFHRVWGEYRSRTAGSYESSPPAGVVVNSDGGIVFSAFMLRKVLAVTGSSLLSAHLLPPETIRVGDRTIPCEVVAFGSGDFPKADPNYESHETLWIDKANQTIVKDVTITDNKLARTLSGAVPANPIVAHGVETTTYPVVILNQPIPPDVFAFTPPANAKLVEDFTNPFAPNPGYAATPHKMPQIVGMMAPDLVLHGADGSSLDLKTLRGKPVLIDLWATWCGPCLLEMPLIDRIFDRTKAAGLVVVGLDEDKNPEDAVNFLRRNHYGWQDYHSGPHDWHLPYTGIPVVELIDAQGKIVYYHSGDDDDRGLVEAIKQLGPGFVAALDNAKE